MKLLVMGGTQFLGRHVVTAALERDHEVTIFHRGQTNPGLFRGTRVVECLGDRDGGLDALGDATWDAVVDTCGYVPRVVDASARFVADRAGLYVFVSSVSVYRDMRMPIDESSAVATLDDPTVEEVTGETYGPLKVLCERAAEDAMPGRVLVVRPGLIVGPHDPTDRFTYWPVRFARGGEVLAPGSPGAPVQIIDARDLAAWIVAMSERGAAGTFSAVGPNEPLTFGEMLDACRVTCGPDATLTWLDDETVVTAGVTPWTGLPCWIPESAGHRGMQTVSTVKAAGAGLGHRPISQIAAETLVWHQTRVGPTLQATLSPDREAEILAAAKG